MTDSIYRTKERIKQTGEVFTSLELVDEILSKLPEEVWSPDKTFLEPSCGSGNFLVRIIAWKIWKGSTAKEALETTFAVDFMEDNVLHAQQRTLTAAFAAEVRRASGIQTRLPPQDLKLELDVGRGKWDTIARELDLPTHDKFCDEYFPIVEQNIVYHNALTYCYRFGDSTAEVTPPQSKDGQCECDLCTKEREELPND